MCLHKPAKFRLPKYGYKLVYIVLGGIQTGVRGYPIKGKGEWNTVRTEGNLYYHYFPEGSYPTGFHMYTSLRSAKGTGLNFHIAKVEYKEVVAKGMEGKFRVFVARQMRIVHIYDRAKSA